MSNPGLEHVFCYHQQRLHKIIPVPGFWERGPWETKHQIIPQIREANPIFWALWFRKYSVHLFRFFIFFVILDTAWICLRNSQKITDIPWIDSPFQTDVPSENNQVIGSAIWGFTNDDIPWHSQSTGWWLSHPSEKWWSESQFGWWHSQYDGKNKPNVPNHQPDKSLEHP